MPTVGSQLAHKFLWFNDVSLPSRQMPAPLASISLSLQAVERLFAYAKICCFLWCHLTPVSYCVGVRAFDRMQYIAL